MDRTHTRTTHLCTCRSSAHCPHRMFHPPREHAWLKGQHGSGLRSVVSPERFRHPSVMSHMLPHLSLLHDLLHPPHLSSDFLLPHCPVLWDWIQKPCEIHGGVAGSTKSASPTLGGHCSSCVVLWHGARWHDRLVLHVEVTHRESLKLSSQVKEPNHDVECLSRK